MRRLTGLISIAIVIAGCGSFKSSFDPNKKYSPKQLERDYDIFENVLKESHPGLYWYTSKDSMDHY
ncbi:MAG TPA: peptidase S41, partial [Chitinophagaceae bacterium]